MAIAYSGNNTYPSTVTYPEDGDALSAASVSAGLVSLADRATYLKAMQDAVGYVLLADYHDVPVSDGDFTSTPYFFEEGGTTFAAVGAGCTCLSAVIGDVIVANAHFAIGMEGESAKFRLTAIDDYAGTPADATMVGGLGFYQVPYTDGNYAEVIDMISLRGRHTVTKAGSTRVDLYAAMNEGSANSLKIYGICAVHVQHWRPR